MTGRRLRLPRGPCWLGSAGTKRLTRPGRALAQGRKLFVESADVVCLCSSIARLGHGTRSAVCRVPQKEGVERVHASHLGGRGVRWPPKRAMQMAGKRACSSPDHLLACVWSQSNTSLRTHGSHGRDALSSSPVSRTRSAKRLWAGTPSSGDDRGCLSGTREASRRPVRLSCS